LTTDRKRTARTAIVLLACSFAAAHMCFLLLPDVFEPWNAKLTDGLFSLRSFFKGIRPAYDDTVVHVDLNDTSLQQLKTYYLNRSHDSTVIRNLAAMNVAAQMYDCIFAARKHDEHDSVLIDAVQKAGNLYLGMAFSLVHEKIPRTVRSISEEGLNYLDATKWKVRVAGDPGSFFIGTNPFITFPELSAASKGLGFINLEHDRDGVFRRVPLLVRYEGAFYPSFAFRTVCDYLNVPPERILVNPGKTITCEGAKGPNDLDRHDIVIPIDRHGEMVVNFIGPWERMDHYNFAGILQASGDWDEMELLKEELQGKIVVVSDISTGKSDMVGPVPTDTKYPLAGIHASAVHTILTESFLRELTGFQMFPVEIVLLLCMLLILRKTSSLFLSIGTALLGGGYFASAVLLFFYGGIILNVLRPLLMVVLVLISMLAYRYISAEKEKEFLRRSFESYFPPSIVKKIMADPQIIGSRGEKKEVTILFSDIKDFSKYTAAVTPDRIQGLLNEYFGAMTEIVFAYSGTVDKFMGDGLMVFFGDPETQPDHALRCVRAAVEMQKKTAGLREEWESRGDMPIQIRIGINTGIVVVGNMGAPKRLSYTVLGSEVNLAQRLQLNAPVGGILISRRTYQLVKGRVTTHAFGKIKAKGFDEPISAYEVLLDEAR
jgi:adenylate cyclase